MQMIITSCVDLVDYFSQYYFRFRTYKTKNNSLRVLCGFSVGIDESKWPNKKHSTENSLSHKTSINVMDEIRCRGDRKNPRLRISSITFKILF